MHNHPQQLAPGINTEFLGIGPYGIERYVQVATQEAARTIVEGNYVGIVIVIEKTAVDFEYFLIVTKNIIDRSYNSVVGIRNPNNPLFKLPVIEAREFNTRCEPLKCGRHIIIIESQR